MLKPRRFQVIDALLLVVATALGLVGIRWLGLHPGSAFLWDPDQGWGAGATFRRLLTAVAVGLPMLSSVMVLVLVARGVGPRPPLRRIARQPGVVACGVVVVMLSVETIARATDLLRLEAARGYLGATWALGGFVRGFTSWWHTEVLLVTLEPGGGAVLAVWVVLAVSRCGRPEPSWVDRLGRVLGTCWIAAALVFWLNHRFFGLDLPGILSLSRCPTGRGLA